MATEEEYEMMEAHIDEVWENPRVEDKSEATTDETGDA